MNSPTQGSFAVLLCTVIGVSLLACQPQGSPDDLNNVVDGKRQVKVYHELRNATKKQAVKRSLSLRGRVKTLLILRQFVACTTVYVWRIGKKFRHEQRGCSVRRFHLDERREAEVVVASPLIFFHDDERALGA